MAIFDSSTDASMCFSQHKVGRWKWIAHKPFKMQPALFKFYLFLLTSFSKPFFKIFFSFHRSVNISMYAIVRKGCWETPNFPTKIWHKKDPFEGWSLLSWKIKKHFSLWLEYSSILTLVEKVIHSLPTNYPLPLPRH